MMKNMFKILNNCPQIVPYIVATTKQFQRHQQKNKNNEYKVFPVSLLLDELRYSGIDMNVCLTTIVVPRSPVIPRDNKRQNNCDGKSCNAERICYYNQCQNRLQKRDQRKVPSNSPKVATINVEEYSDACNQNYEEQAYYDSDEELEAGSYDEQFHEPGNNNVQTGKT